MNKNVFDTKISVRDKLTKFDFGGITGIEQAAIEVCGIGKENGYENDVAIYPQCALYAAGVFAATGLGGLHW